MKKAAIHTPTVRIPQGKKKKTVAGMHRFLPSFVHDNTYKRKLRGNCFNARQTLTMKSQIFHHRQSLLKATSYLQSLFCFSTLTDALFLGNSRQQKAPPPTPKKKRKAVLTENIVEEVAVVVVGLKTLLQGGPTLQQKNHMHPDTKPTPVFSIATIYCQTQTSLQPNVEAVQNNI